MRRLLPIILLLSLNCALATERLNWLVMPVPGGFNLVDGQLKDGFGLELMQQLEPFLREQNVEVSYALSTLPRLQTDLQAGRQVCVTALLQTPERDRMGIFVPLWPLPPRQLVVREADLSRLPLNDGAVDIAALFKGPLRGGMQIGRVYPPPLAELLAKGVQQGKVIEVTVNSTSDNHLLMLSHGRFDYLIEYPLVAAQMMRQGRLPAPLSLVPLAGQDALEMAGAYCDPSPWGRNMAERIGKALHQQLRQTDVMQIYDRWLPPSSYGVYAQRIRDSHRQRAEAPASP